LILLDAAKARKSGRASLAGTVCARRASNKD
jgi:hypothetical protein